MQTRDEVQRQMFGHIEQWQQSGISQKAFCKEVSLSYHIFHYWYKLYRDKDNTPSASSFIKLGVPAISAASGTLHAEIVLPNGKRLLFHQPVSADYLRALIN